MRVLFTCNGLSGHFHPLVPFAQALEVAGHEVAFACSEDNRPAVEATGFRLFPAGTSMRDLMPQLMPQLLPIGADQPQNAARCDLLGVGRVVGPTSAHQK